MAHDRPPRDKKTQPPAYLPSVDGLRAVAVLSVMIYHLRPTALPGGFIGVDMFFVISGTVVTLSMLRTNATTFFDLVKIFYAKRLKRVIPAVVIMLVGVSLAAVAFIPNAWLSEVNRSTAYYAFYGISNIFLIGQDEDYFQPRADYNPFIHTWSLGVEEQFYLIFPALIAPAALGRGAMLKSLSIAATIMLCAVSFALCASWTKSYPTFSYFAIQTRFWELGVGVLLALSISSDICKKLSRRLLSALQLLQVLSLTALFVGFAIASDTRFPYPWALLPVVSTAILIFAAAADPRAIVNRILAQRIFVLVGLISYSLYLWHWPIYVLMRWTVGLQTIAQMTIAVSLTFLLAIASYLFIETPFRVAIPFHRLPKTVTIGLLLTMALVGAKVADRIYGHSDALSLSVTNDRETWNPYKKNFAEGQCKVASAYRDVQSFITL